MVDAVVLGFADRLVEAAAPAGRGDHVPQPDATCRKAFEPRVIGQRLQLFPDRAAEQAPELVGRMRIVTFGRERGVAGQAAEYELARVRPSDRRQSGFDAQE